LGGDPTDLSSILSETRVLADSSYIPLSRFVVETRARDFKNIIAGVEGTYYPLPLEVKSNRVKSTMTEIDRMVKGYPEFEVNYSGSWFSNKSLMWELFTILIVALLLLVFILSAQFESLIQPLIILSEIVFDISGALLLLWVCGVSINLMSMIGIVVMVAIVINDSILKVDTMNRLRKEGYGLLHAVMLGGLRRVKPIIMTSLTTILAVCPLLFTTDMGSELQYPLALAVISGMFVGTLASIFFVPLLYYRIYVKR
jgi:multidrug efflux pump subunit AcrB